MGAVPNYIGEFRKGDTVQIPVDYYNSGWTPAYFDVIDNDSKTFLLADQAVTSGGPPEWIVWVQFTVTEANYTEGRTYTIIVKDAQGDRPTETSNYFFMTFRIKARIHQCFLGTCERGKTFYFMVREPKTSLYYDVYDCSDGTTISTDTALTSVSTRLFRGSIDTSASDYIEGRTYSIRVKDQTGTPDWDVLYSFTVISPTEANFAQILANIGGGIPDPGGGAGGGTSGTVLDNFVYDQAGNITSLRFRLFATAADANNATAGVTDPEPGEISYGHVTQEHDVPRNVRTFHRSVIDWTDPNLGA